MMGYPFLATQLRQRRRDNSRTFSSMPDAILPHPAALDRQFKKETIDASSFNGGSYRLLCAGEGANSG